MAEAGERDGVAPRPVSLTSARSAGSFRLFGRGSYTHEKGGEGVVVTEKARKIKKKRGVPAAVWRCFADG